MIVLVSYNKPRSEGLFVNLFADSLEEAGIDVRFFSVPDAMFRRIDVFNLHWPELVTAGSNWPKRIAKWLALAVLLVRVRLQKIPVVHTVHNLRPHEESHHSVAGLIQQLLLRSVDVRVYINESTENDYSRGPVLLHGKYPPPTADPGPSPDGGVLFFGRLRRYKGIEKLVGAYQALGPGSLPPLSIVGMANEQSYEDELARLVDPLDDVQLKAGFASDEDLNRMILASHLVALPYEHMYNSGVALLTLSSGRPILVPDSPANRALQDEVGAEWVHIFPGHEEGAELADRITAAYGVRPLHEPNLSRRDWPEIAALYAALFRALRAEGRGGWRRALDRTAWTQHSHINATALGDGRGG